MHNFVVFDQQSEAEAYWPHVRYRFPGSATNRDEFNQKLEPRVVFSAFFGGWIILVKPVASRTFVILEKNMI